MPSGVYGLSSRALHGLPDPAAREAAASDSCTLLTTAPNEVKRLLHHRMPLILLAADSIPWFDPSEKDLE